MKPVPNSILLKSSMSWCSALLRSTRRSLPLRISIPTVLLLSLTACSGGVLIVTLIIAGSLWIMAHLAADASNDADAAVR
jgi:hypothetical protein